jgi:hypothetical protein
LKEEHRDWWCGKCRRGYVEQDGRWVPCWCLRRNLFFEQLVLAGVPNGSEIFPPTKITETQDAILDTRNEIVGLMERADRELDGTIASFSGPYRSLVALSIFAHLVARGRSGAVVSLEMLATNFISHRELWIQNRQQPVLVVPFGFEMDGGANTLVFLHLIEERQQPGFLTLLVQECEYNEIGWRYRTKDERADKVSGEKATFYSRFNAKVKSIPTGTLGDWVGKSEYEACKQVVRWNLNK